MRLTVVRGCSPGLLLVEIGRRLAWVLRRGMRLLLVLMIEVGGSSGLRGRWASRSRMGLSTTHASYSQASAIVRVLACDDLLDKSESREAILEVFAQRTWWRGEESEGGKERRELTSDSPDRPPGLGDRGLVRAAVGAVSLLLLMHADFESI